MAPVVVIVEYFENYRELEGYVANVQKTYLRMKIPFTVDYGIIEVDNNLLFKTEVIVYGNKRHA